MKHSSATESDLLMILTWVLELIDNRVVMKDSSATESDLLLILTWF